MIIDQGKFDIDPNGVVYNYGQTYTMKNMTVPQMEKDISDLLSKPVNDTASSNTTEEAMFVNE